MDALLTKKRTCEKISGEESQRQLHVSDLQDGCQEESTDIKIAIISSLYPKAHQADLLDLLVKADGSVEKALHLLDASSARTSPAKTAVASVGGYQSSLSAFRSNANSHSSATSLKRRGLTRKGQTLHLYAPDDIAAHTPCSIIHKFLPSCVADELLRELLVESATFEKETFKLFDNVVQSPHSACFYVGSSEELTKKRNYLYNGHYLKDVRQTTPQMQMVSLKVKAAVNSEIAKRIEQHYPDGKKLRYQSPKEWQPNAAFVNCYEVGFTEQSLSHYGAYIGDGFLLSSDWTAKSVVWFWILDFSQTLLTEKGGNESVGYHSDQLTYLGPRAVIGSLSLGVAREFRVRKIVARDGKDGLDQNNQRADAEGQIAIHLPHNSCLIMHAEMQEEWKHSIHPARVIDPHHVAGKKRINITYRHYRESFDPKYTPRCHCQVATVLRCAQRTSENRGRYMWMCHVGNTPGKEGCSFFQWAEFDDDGEPPWLKTGA